MVVDGFRRSDETRGVMHIKDKHANMSDVPRTQLVSDCMMSS